MMELRKRAGVRLTPVGPVVLALAAAIAAGCQPGLVTGVGADDPADRSPEGLDDARLYVEQHTPARLQMEEWQETRPEDASYLARIADEAQAVWFGDWTRDVSAAVRGVMASSAAAGALPVLVAYNIPQRDCGSYSAGGARDGPAYLGWIRDFARGLAGHRAVVVLEPDATASIDCLSRADVDDRLDLLRQAVSLLKGAGALVYLDAGHAFWKTPAEMAPILRSAGIANADGFALNVSNYHATSANIQYGTALSELLGGTRFVIDTSRNGLATASPFQWCNAQDQGLGERPRVNPGPALVDAYLWVKRPGESDGTCNGGPAAGEWWPDHALGLAKRQPVAIAAGP